MNSTTIYTVKLVTLSYNKDKKNLKKKILKIKLII